MKGLFRAAARVRSHWATQLLASSFLSALIGFTLQITKLSALDSSGRAYDQSSYAGKVGFLAVFGMSKALANLSVGLLVTRLGYMRTELAGWLLGVAMPLLALSAQPGTAGWRPMVAANVFLGLQQGLCWSVTVLVMILILPATRRGLASGLNETLGYAAVAAAAPIYGVLEARMVRCGWNVGPQQVSEACRTVHEEMLHSPTGAVAAGQVASPASNFTTPVSGRLGSGDAFAAAVPGSSWYSDPRVCSSPDSWEPACLGQCRCEGYNLLLARSLFVLLPVGLVVTALLLVEPPPTPLEEAEEAAAEAAGASAAAGAHPSTARCGPAVIGGKDVFRQGRTSSGDWEQVPLEGTGELGLSRSLRGLESSQGTQSTHERAAKDSSGLTVGGRSGGGGGGGISGWLRRVLAAANPAQGGGGGPPNRYTQLPQSHDAHELVALRQARSGPVGAALPVSTPPADPANVHSGGPVYHADQQQLPAQALELNGGEMAAPGEPQGDGSLGEAADNDEGFSRRGLGPSSRGRGAPGEVRFDGYTALPKGGEDETKGSTGSRFDGKLPQGNRGVGGLVESSWPRTSPGGPTEAQPGSPPEDPQERPQPWTQQPSFLRTRPRRSCREGFRRFGSAFVHYTFRNPSTASMCIAGLVSNALTSLAWGLVLTWARDTLGVPGPARNLITSAYSFLKGLVQLLSGAVSDSAGRKGPVLVGLALNAAGLATSACGAGWGGALLGATVSAGQRPVVQFGYVLLGACLMGAGAGVFYPVMPAAVVDHHGQDGHSLAEGMATYRFWRDLGYAAGALGGPLADLAGVEVTLLIAAAICLGVACIVAVAYKEKPPGGTSTRKLVDHAVPGPESRGGRLVAGEASA